MLQSITQEEIDYKNSQFWDELCGSSLAKHLGVTDSSIESLAKYDQFYFDYYPYLANYLQNQYINGKTVLEVGLGYGTMSQYLAECGANYYGLDISNNAVKMAQHRLLQNNLQGQVQLGNMLQCPFPDNYFDTVISIGCFHHTGNINQCINETYRILKPGGRAIIMVYNKFSLRQWAKWPLASFKNLLLQWLGQQKKLKVTQSQCLAYDASVDGTQAAPETQFFSKIDIHALFANFNQIKITRENFDEQFRVGYGKYTSIYFGSRMKRLGGFWAKYMGLDLYIEATK